MSAPGLSLTIAGAALASSLHCAAMCGPFVAIATSGRPRSLLVALYNLGRLSTYGVLGLLAGVSGGLIDEGLRWAGLYWGAGVVSGALLVLWGGLLLAEEMGFRRPVRRSGSSPMARRLRPLFGWIYRLAPPRRAYLLGAMTTLLPCGVLYAFVVAAAGSGSPLAGLAIMTAFWAGTVPALVAIGFGAGAVGRRLRQRAPLVVALVLLIVGGGTLAMRLAMDPTHQGHRHGPAPVDVEVGDGDHVHDGTSG